MKTSFTERYVVKRNDEIKINEFGKDDDAIDPEKKDFDQNKTK